MYETSNYSICKDQDSTLFVAYSTGACHADVNLLELGALLFSRPMGAIQFLIVFPGFSSQNDTEPRIEMVGSIPYLTTGRFA